jgi:lipopolysaccharide/colanic/teichoic acid biosynthesis glycosyltransferase
VVSSLGLMVCLPLFLMIAIRIKLDPKGPVVFTQQRIGKNFRPFWIYKFRSMAAVTPGVGRQISVANDPRITRLGRFLRNSQTDELPLLTVRKCRFNISDSGRPRNLQELLGRKL